MQETQSAEDSRRDPRIPSLATDPRRRTGRRLPPGVYFVQREVCAFNLFSFNPYPVNQNRVSLRLHHAVLSERLATR